MQRIWAILFLLAPWLAAGPDADQPLTLPDWLATPQDATSVTTTTSTASVDLAYLLPLPPNDVTSRYQKQLEKAGVRFKTSFDGIGNAISASTESVSCMVRIAEADNGSHVRIGCASTSAKPTSQATPLPVQSASPTQPPPASAAPNAHPAPQATGPGTHTVEYAIEGPEQRVSITGRNAAGGTEQHEVSVPYDFTMYVRGRFFVYLSAQRKGQAGMIRVVIHVDGKILQEANASSPYGIATASGLTE